MKPQEQELVSAGRFNFGRFDAPFAAVNPLDAQPFNLPVPRRIRDFRLKEWLAFQIANERFFFNIALFNAKLVAMVQVKVFDRERKTKHLFEKKVVPWLFRGPTQLLDSTMEYHSKGHDVCFRNRLAQDRMDISFALPATGACPSLAGEMAANFSEQTPLVVAIPFGDNRGMYSHKGMVPVEGKLVIDGTPHEFRRDSSYLLMDDHRGYYPWEMQWDWLTSGRVDSDGKLFGFNLTSNDSCDPEAYNENAFWYGGKRHDLGAVHFRRVDGPKGEVWEIRDHHGRVHVDFDVEVPAPIDMNVLVVKSRYRAPFGACRGYLADESGQKYPVDGMFGMGEDFYLRI